MAKQIGQILALVKPVETGSLQQFEKSTIDRLMQTGPVTLAECEILKEWAYCQPTRPEPATPTQIADNLEWVAATLPSRMVDEETGRKRFAVYTRMLAGYSPDALSFMIRRACETLDWFPTPHQCLEILKEYRPPAMPRDTALYLVQRSAQEMFDAWIEQLPDGEIGDVPERWKRIAVERGALRLADGEFQIRAERRAA